MANHLLTLIAVVCALFPFLLIILASPDESLNKITKTNTLIFKLIKKSILISTPIWFPVLYIGLILLEIEIRKSSAFTFGKSYLGNYLMFAVPAGWAIAICRNSKSLLLYIVLVPPLYVVGIFTSGIIGWMACDAANICR